MKAELLLRERIVIAASAFVELVVWKVPEPLAGSIHSFKYRLALVENGRCTLRYDNEAGKGDHKHFGEVQADYVFEGLEQLQMDFWADVDARRER